MSHASGVSATLLDVPSAGGDTEYTETTDDADTGYHQETISDIDTTVDLLLTPLSVPTDNRMAENISPTAATIHKSNSTTQV